MSDGSRAVATATGASPVELLQLFSEYVDCAAPAGAYRDRLDAWAAARATAHRCWESLLEADRFAQNLDEAALWKLLPYENGPEAQHHGAFVHPLAPAVSGDVRAMLQGPGRVRHEQWPDLGRGLFELVRRCTEHASELWQAVEAFLALPGAQFFTCDLVSPVLHALRPSEFVLLDARARAVLNHVTGSSFVGSLRDYPAAHLAARRLLADLRPVLLESALCDRRPEDVFEGFCHWFVHVRMAQSVPEASNSPSDRPCEALETAAGAPDWPESPSPALDGGSTQEPPPPAAAHDVAPEPQSEPVVAVQPSPAEAPTPPQPLEPMTPVQASMPTVPAFEMDAADDEATRVAPSVVLAPCRAPAMTLLDRARAALQRRGQLVLAGPPGSGKSHLARRLAEDLVAQGDGVLEHLVFHGNWRYADFVQLVRPDGTRHAGRFQAFCRQAAARRGPSVLLIDDAEHAELADVFGEALALLDARGREVTLAGGGTLLVPHNARLILTLDGGGRNGRAALAQLLRACAVLRVHGDEDELRRRHPEAGFVESLLDLRRAIGAEIGDPERSLPLAFFLRAKLPGELPDVWRTEVEPFLVEELAGEPSRAAAYRWEAVAARLGCPEQPAQA